MRGFHDLRYACRSLRRSPGFTFIVVATLALGIGANLTMFSLMRAVLWRQLPYPEPNRIVTIQVDARNRPNTGATPGEVLDLKERSRSFEQVSTIDSVDANLEYQGEMEHVAAASASGDFLPLLGVRPSLGRALDARIDLGLDARIDMGKEQAFAILISDELWKRRFSADRAILGKIVKINDAEMHIAGVLPPGFRLFLPPSVMSSEQIDVWLPHGLSATRQYRGIPSWRGSGRALRSTRRTPSCRRSRRNSSGSIRNSIPVTKDGRHRRPIAAPAKKCVSRRACCTMS